MCTTKDLLPEQMCERAPCVPPSERNARHGSGGKAMVAKLNRPIVSRHHCPRHASLRSPSGPAGPAGERGG